MESPFNISERTVIYKVESNTSQAIIISKDEKVMALLNKYLDGVSVLSPTALDKYLTCSLQFYFMYVAGLKESEEIAEEVDAQIFGLLFHKSMENIYRTFKGKILDNVTIDAIIKDSEHIEKTIHNAFQKVYFRKTGEGEKVELMGKNGLIFEIVKKCILQILSIDRNRSPFRIEGLEKNVSIQLFVEKSFQKVLIGGIIDRIDRFDDYLQILDYKTGKTELSYPVLSSLFDRENKSRNKAAFQTLVYSYILYKGNPAEKSIKPGIYDLRSIFKEDYDVFVKCKENGNEPVDFASIAGQFEEYFKVLLEEIFDVNIPFEQTRIEENCIYCPYKQICRR
jgi:ATP-dependent helicase/DNAse subunit B